MSKLLKMYEAKPTLANAIKVARYHARHPFGCILLDTYEQTWLEVALDHAKEG